MAPVAPGATVAITGATGLIGAHVCQAALAAGYCVRAVVRDPGNEAKVAHLLALGGAGERLTLHKGNLDEPGSYDEAFAGADAVVHTAAVVEIDTVADPEGQIVRPSVKGTENVLASMDKAETVRRFVHTSSIIAACKWDGAPDASFAEADWNTASTVANGDPYGYAKVTAERLVHGHASGGYDSVVMLPGVNLGPCLCKAHTKASAVVIRQFMFGNRQAEYYAHFVDVRDTADAHVRALALAVPEGDSRRFLLRGDGCSMPVSELEAPLRRLFPEYKFDAAPMPGYWARRALSVPLLWRLFASEFGCRWVEQRFQVDNGKSKNQLGVSYRPFDETLGDTVRSMVDTGFVKPRA